MSEILMRAKTETMGRKHGNNVSKHWLCIASGNKTLDRGNKSIGFLILTLQANYGTRSSTCNTHSHVMKKRGNAEGCPVTSLFCQVRKSLEKKTNSLFFLSQKNFKILYHNSLSPYSNCPHKWVYCGISFLCLQGATVKSLSSLCLPSCLSPA